MMRRSFLLLSGGMKEFADWHLREPLLINYEGWRILDNPKHETRYEYLTGDFMGSVRHIDPIIDDPRLTHQQRVCRLYRWALIEMNAQMVFNNPYQFNLATKVIRKRFEKYRYVTDPAACDMMVRESQKYLRDCCSFWPLKQNATSMFNCAYHSNPIHHPDHCQVYDHWTSNEVMMYEDAKLHLYVHHHPAFSVTFEHFERFGWLDFPFHWRFLTGLIGAFIVIFTTMKNFGLFYPEVDTRWGDWTMLFKDDLRVAIAKEERLDRSRWHISSLGHDWGVALGVVQQKEYPSEIYMLKNYKRQS